MRGLVGLIEGQGAASAEAEVREIMVEGRAGDRRAPRVRRPLRADVVVSNADSAWTYRQLLPANATAAAGPRRARAGALFDEPVRLVLRHSSAATPTSPTTRFCWARATASCCSDIFERKVLADDFSLYLHRPTATDPSLAPPGCDAFYVLSPVPHLEQRYRLGQQAEPYRAAIAAAAGARPCCPVWSSTS